ncbi:MAG: AsmA family protein [Sphingobacteriales bacterium]|nr:MAG: AsmA family protein [Sphingobacteriales bacterium]
MGKAFKYIFVTLAVLIVLVVGAAVIIPFVFKDKIIEFAKAEANKKINAQVDFDNDISISILRSFPNLSVGVNNLKVINKAPFAGDTLAYIPELRATLDIMSVINGDKMDVKSFYLGNPRINLVVNDSGIANWDITFPDQDSLAAAGKDTTSNFRMGLQKYELADATIVYDDRTMPFFIKLDSMDHEGNGDFTQDVFELVTKTNAQKMTVAYGGVEYLTDVKTDYDAKFKIDMKNSKYSFMENELVLNDLPLSFDGYVAMPTDDIEMDVKFAAKKSEFKSFLSLIPAIYSRDFKNLRASGTLALSGFVKGLMTDNAYPAFNIKFNINNGFFQYPDLPYPVKSVFVDTDISSPGGDLNNTVVNVKRATFNMAGEPFDARLLVKTPMTDPYMDGALKGRVVLENMGKVIKLEQGTKLAGTVKADVTMKGNMSAIEKEQYEKFNAAGFITAQNVNYASKDLAQPINVQTARMDFNPQTVKLSNFAMTAGASDLKADGTFTNLLGYVFKDQLLKGNMNLSSNFFDVNPWMAPDNAQPAPNAEEKPMEAVDLPANLDFTLNANMQHVVYDNLDFKNMKGNLVLRDKKLAFNDVSTDLLDGNFKMNGFYDSRNIKQPLADMKLNINQISIKELFTKFNTVQAFMPIAKYMTGKMSADLSMNTILGKDMSPLLTSLSSIGRLNIPYAEIANYLPIKKISDQLNLAKFDPMQLKDIRPSFFIEKGRVNLREPIKFNIDKIKANLTGSSGLDRTMDYIMALDIPAADAKKFMGDQIRNLLKQKGINVPAGVDLPIGDIVKLDVFITGSPDNPIIKTSLKDFGINTLNAIKNKAKEEVTKKVEEVKEDVSAKVKEQRDKIMREAETKAAQIRSQGDQVAEKARTEGYKAAQDVENKATNPVAKIAAKKVADRMRKETDEKVNRIKSEANKQADDVMNKAREQAARL